MIKKKSEGLESIPKKGESPGDTNSICVLFLLGLLGVFFLRVASCDWAAYFPSAQYYKNCSDIAALLKL